MNDKIYLIYYNEGDMQGSTTINIGYVSDINKCQELIEKFKKKYPKGFNKNNLDKCKYINGVRMYVDNGNFYYQEINKL